MSPYCPTCRGTGLMPGARRLTLVGEARKTCVSCGGSGSIADVLLAPDEPAVKAVFLFDDGVLEERVIPRRLAGKLVVTAHPKRLENVVFRLHHIDGGVFHYEEQPAGEKAQQ